MPPLWASLMGYRSIPPAGPRPLSTPPTEGLTNSSHPPPTAPYETGRALPSSIPPRPPSIPVREEGFSGARGPAVRFRPTRYTAAELPGELQCRARCKDALIGPLQIVDLGAAGFAAAIPTGVTLPPGTVLHDLELSLDGRPIWSGQAVVVHSDVHRVGARFSSSLLDLRHVRIGVTLETRMSMLRAQRDRLPSSWRAAVGDLRQLLEDARLELEEFERNVPADPLYRVEEEAALFGELQARWGASYYAAITALHEQSRSLDAASIPLAESYASAALMPLLQACPDASARLREAAGLRRRLPHDEAATSPAISRATGCSAASSTRSRKGTRSATRWWRAKRSCARRSKMPSTRQAMVPCESSRWQPVRPSKSASSWDERARSVARYT